MDFFFRLVLEKSLHIEMACSTILSIGLFYWQSKMVNCKGLCNWNWLERRTADIELRYKNCWFIAGPGGRVWVVG